MAFCCSHPVARGSPRESASVESKLRRGIAGRLSMTSARSSSAAAETSREAEDHGGRAGKRRVDSEKRRQRPPLEYTSQICDRVTSTPRKFVTPEVVSMRVIGTVESPYKERFGTPRQPTVTEQTVGNAAQTGVIRLHDGMGLELALRGLEGFEFCWVICYMHLNTGWNALIMPPRGPRVKQGVFATRAPHRPNSLSLSALRIVRVDHHERCVLVHGLDLLDGTPVLDIKPYVPYADAFPNARAGWLDSLRQEEPDILLYSPAPAHLLAPRQPAEENDGDDAAHVSSPPPPA